MTVPETVARYTYIGDVDILVLDKNVVQHHVAVMKKTGLPYSNTVRAKDHSRFSGLHFTETKEHYPLPDLSGLDLRRMNDEHVLREIVMRKGMPILDQVLSRPVHGIHMIPNRPAVWAGEMRKDGRRMLDWGIRPWHEQYAAFADSPAFRELRPHLVGLALSSIDTIDSFYSARCVGS